MNKPKILIVGGVAGGASTATRLRRLAEQQQIILFEKGSHVSFSNCSLPYYLSDMVDSAERLVMMNPEKFHRQFNIEARIEQEVVAIDRKNKTISVINHATGANYQESYDKLILSPGAKPIIPPIIGRELVNLHTIRNVNDIIRLKNHLNNLDKPHIAVIGGGFIGVEVAENLCEAGYQVSLIEAQEQVLRNFDYDMVQILHKELIDHGINLIVNDKVTSFADNQVNLASGISVSAQIVVMAIGVAPEIELAKSSGLTIAPTGAIAVNQYYQTDDPDIYAIGDAIEIENALTKRKQKLSLAGPAQKQARAVANHIHGIATTKHSYIGSSCIKVFEQNAASTGLTEFMLKTMNLAIEYDTVILAANDKVSLMPDNSVVHFKLIYDRHNRRVLGAQAIGKGNVDKRIDVIATAIKFNATIDDLCDLELCYAPPYGTAKDVVNLAGYVASNLSKNTFQQFHVASVRDLVASGAYILDIRETHELAKGQIINAQHIPLSQLRQRLTELPQQQAIYLYCRSGQRGYNACLLLQQYGFRVYNLAGGFLTLSYFEYFNNHNSSKQTIITGYNFN
jgi:NADPH-dependent 2,4-dienoyl-CoA reductase/sulfur reductase-like enzyme